MTTKTYGHVQTDIAELLRQARGLVLSGELPQTCQTLLPHAEALAEGLRHASAQLERRAKV